MPSMAEDEAPTIDDTSDASDIESSAKQEKMKTAKEKMSPDDADDSRNEDTPSSKPKYDPKDPLRPRRKKARRACYACQRAHLTCGDERPCQRCVKRGLAEGCEDGVRKKAKYLHDAPPEALRPVLGPAFNQLNNSKSTNNASSSDVEQVGGSNASPASTTAPNQRSNSNARGSVSDTSSVNGFFAPTNSPYPMFQGNRPGQMAPPLQDSLSFNSQPSPVSPNFQSPGQRTGSMQSMTGPIIQPPTSNLRNNSFGGNLFDPTNPSMFNFDLEGLGFGNHYGALEFGMLNHMSSGAAETPPQDNNGLSQPGDVGFNGGVFGNNVGNFGQPMYTPQGTLIPEFMDHTIGFGDLAPGLPHAYAISNGPTNMQSPSTDNSPQPSTMFDSPTATAYTSGTTPHATPSFKPKRIENKSKTNKSLVEMKRDPSSIYETVQQPYSYTTGFHSLTAYIQKRFNPNATLKIAKSLASIRPSFISCTKTLNRQDLIFMEKCFQRTLFEYEDFMVHCCTPTLVLRRTGEVAAVNKEFTLLCGWTRDVLLGNEPNLNTNTGRSSANGSDSGNSTGRAGLATPRLRTIERPDQEGRPQPVFVAELMDDESVIEFYDDFAKLAFGDSRGSVTSKCRLLSYQTKRPGEGDGLADGGDQQRGTKRKEVGDDGANNNSAPGGHVGGSGTRFMKIEGEGGIEKLRKDGKLECSYCWTVKRDVFDIPMMIVMNFLPFIPDKSG